MSLLMPHSFKQRNRANQSGHQGGIIWLTGLSGAGKSTLAMSLEHKLFDLGYISFVLDGDHLRSGINADLGFSTKDRSENVRRTAEIARLFADSGSICIVSLISPLTEHRATARQLAGEYPFYEIYIAADIQTCTQRDPKGLYKKALNSEISDFTGIHSPYEPPYDPDLTIETTQLSLSESENILLNFALSKFPYPRQNGHHV